MKDEIRIDPQLRSSLRDAVARAVRLRLRGVDVEEKSAARALNGPAVREARREARAALGRWEGTLLEHFARASDVNPARIRPRLELVEHEAQKRLFRFASLHWSIPVSQGYGRRLRFLVVDDTNQKLIGIIGLGDPVYALADRDAWIGWSKERRERVLRCVMDAFALGAVAPYSMLLGGKLVCALATSSEVQDAFWQRYRHSSALISGRQQRSRLALLTTTSAFGRSSMYNRVRLDGRELWTRIGTTRGHGEFLFSGSLYDRLYDLVDQYSAPSARAKGWGDAIYWRNRREVVRKALGLLGLPYRLHLHGLAREIYAAPLAENAQAWLAGKERALHLAPRSAEELGRAALERWVLPRSLRQPEWKSFDRDSLRLWSSSERQRAVR